MTLIKAIRRLRALEVDPEIQLMVNAIIGEELAGVKEYKQVKQEEANPNNNLLCDAINERGNSRGEKCNSPCVDGFANCYKHLNRKGQPNSDERSNIYTLKTNARKDWKQSVHASKFNFNDCGIMALNRDLKQTETNMDKNSVNESNIVAFENLNLKERDQLTLKKMKNKKIITFI